MSKNCAFEWEIDKPTRESFMRTHRLFTPYYMFLLFMVTVFSFKAFSETDHSVNQSADNNPWTKLYQELELKKDIRVEVNTPYYHVDEMDVDLHSTYNGWDKINNQRIRTREISKKALEMIKKADKHILITTFLFDCMLNESPTPYDVVKEFKELLINKKKNNREIKITVMLDPLNRAYGDRISLAAKELNQFGIDVFYSDLLESKSATNIGTFELINHIGRFSSQLTLGLGGNIWDLLGLTPLTPVLKLTPAPSHLDGENINLRMVMEAALLKANHRKMLVTDIMGSDDFEALVSSANPHNASDDSTNHALSVKGNLAKYIYMSIREDIAHSIIIDSNELLRVRQKNILISEESQKKYAIKGKLGINEIKKYISKQLPAVTYQEDQNRGAIKVKYASESQIKKEILKMLKSASANDKVRIQMFYLSEPEIIEGIIAVANDKQRSKNNPVLLLLDPNKDAFNSIKDGTPNRQVAYHLLKNIEAGKIIVRWYSTHGEQNHAKIMSITNETSKKYELTTGSCNWTGKNMNSINMESNLFIYNAKRLNDKFNEYFDRAFLNRQKDVEYSLDYEIYDLLNTYQMVIGYSIFAKIKDKDEFRKNWKNEKFDLLFMSILKENEDLFNLSSNEYNQRINDMIENNPTTIDRLMFTIMGKEKLMEECNCLRLDQSEQFIKWKKAYLKKWLNGEKGGRVSW